MEVFNLEAAILEWKRELRKQQGLEPGFIEEIEGNLRDRIDDYLDDGCTEEQAFFLARKKSLGNAEELADEYFKARISKAKIPPWKQKQGTLLFLLPLNVKLAFRNLLNYKAFSLINIVGLSIGITACLMITQYVYFELGYDQFHQKADQIYRVRHDRYIGNELQYQKAQAFIPTGQAMMDEYPEVKAYTTLFPISEQSDIIVSYQNEQGETKRFAEEAVFHVKGDFFRIFTFPITVGQKDLTALAPNTVLISKSTSRKYFGDESPIGKTISHNYSPDYTIVGVFDDVPANSHLKFDFLFAWMPVTDEESGGDENNWRWDGFYTYLLLTPKADAQALEAKFSDFIDKHHVGRVNEKVYSEFALQPLTDIHLYSRLQGEAEPNGDPQVVYTLLIIGITILIIAWINYVNLTTSQSLSRLKNVGILKAIGSRRRDLIVQFLIEAMLINILSTVIAIMIALVLHITFSEFINVTLSSSLFLRWEFWVAVVVMFLVGSIASGIYPALVISSYNPLRALKGKRDINSHQSLFNVRHGLVVFQFAISIALITGALVVYQQLSFMKAQRLGFDIDQTLVVNTQATFGPPGSDSLFVQSLSTVKNRLNGYSAIQKVTASHDIPGKEHLSNIPSFRHSKNPQEYVSLFLTRIDYDFISAFDISLLAGRNFKQGVDGRESLILNVEALKTLGFNSPQEAIGQQVTWGDQQRIGNAEVVGVVDFRSTSFKSKNYPVAYTSQVLPYKYLSVKFTATNGDNIEEVISMVKQEWEDVFPETPFDYFFLDDFFNRQYQEERKFSQILALFTFLGITIACLGLYAIALLTVLRRTKEVGVRKVLGASVGQIVQLLSKEFIFLIAAAGIITLPFIYMGMKAWLTNYPTRIHLDWWLFLLPIVTILFVALLTISRQTIKAALANPVKSLKYE